MPAGKVARSSTGTLLPKAGEDACCQDSQVSMLSAGHRKQDRVAIDMSLSCFQVFRRVDLHYGAQCGLSRLFRFQACHDQAEESCGANDDSKSLRRVLNFMQSP